MLRSLLLFLPCCVALRGVLPRRMPVAMMAAPQRARVAADALQQGGARSLANLKSRGDEILLVDGDNVRGKAGWMWSAAELAEEVDELSFALGGRVVLFIDHGERRCAVSRGNCTLAFAGPRGSADDAMVDAVEFLLERGESVTLVTSQKNRPRVSLSLSLYLAVVL